MENTVVQPLTQRVYDLDSVLAMYNGHLKYSWEGSNRLLIQYPDTVTVLRKLNFPVVKTYGISEYGFNQWKSRMEATRTRVSGLCMTFWSMPDTPWYEWYGNKRRNCPGTLTVVLQKQMLDDLDKETIRALISAQLRLFPALLLVARTLSEPEVL